MIKISKYRLIIFLIVAFLSAVSLLVFLDYFNLESIQLLNQRGFYFEYTWKGRMFLLMFSLLFVFESVLNWQKLGALDHQKPRDRFKILFAVAFALLPIAYIIGINFLNLSQTVISLGEALRGNYWRTTGTSYLQILMGEWPITLEYVVFTISFVGSIILAYGKSGMKFFSISLGFVGSISTFYAIDTWFPFGDIWPLQILTRPTAASAATVLKALGYQFSLTFPLGLASAPIITTHTDLPTSLAIEWPCAGVHSLLIYVLIVMLFFKTIGISNFRKIVYFIAGIIGTFAVNVFRIVTYVAILTNQGIGAANNFHDTYGELFSLSWLLSYIVIILFIERSAQMSVSFHKFLKPLQNNWKRVILLLLSLVIVLSVMTSIQLGSSYTVGDPATPVSEIPAATPITNLTRTPIVTQNDQFLDMLIDLIPRNSSVLTENNLFSRLSGIKATYFLPLMSSFQNLADFQGAIDNVLKRVDFILVDGKTDSTVVTAIFSRRAPDFGIIAEANGVILLKKGYTGFPTMFVPYKDVIKPTDLVAINGKIIDDPLSENQNVLSHSSSDPVGDFWYGPGLFLSRGVYSTGFRLKISDNSTSPIIVLAVVAWPAVVKTEVNSSGVMGAQQSITLGSLPQKVLATILLEGRDFAESGKYQTFKLQFAVDQPGGFEFVGLSAQNETEICLDYIELQQVLP